MISQNPTRQTQSLQVEFSLDVVNIPESVNLRATAKAREAYVMALLAEGEISSGKAARLLGISRMEMIDQMGKWNISLFDDSLGLDELRAEVKQASDILDQTAG